MNRGTAFVRVHRAQKAGLLVRPDRCEVCNRTEDEIRSYIAERRGACKASRSVIHAHHHAGYDHPLDVWWVCTECNGMLWHRHDDSLTLADVQAMWKQQRGVTPIVLAGNRKVQIVS